MQQRCCLVLKKIASLCVLVECLVVCGDAFAEEEPHWLVKYRNAGPELFNDAGYRKSQYRAPTPPLSRDAIRINTGQLQVMLVSEKPPKLINVLPLKTYNNGFLIKKAYTHIASSVWLPNVGRGEISLKIERWFFKHLERVSERDRAAPLVFYCRADCWMSWNAIKRVARAGYTGLYWYRDGLDGWRENNLPEVAAVPESYFSQD